LSLKKSVISATKWSFLSEIAHKAITLTIFIVLARILTPKDFGLVALATIIISLPQIFWDSGLSAALIQTREKIDEIANIVFWTNFILGVLIYATVYCLAPFIAKFFKEPLAVAVIQVQGFQIILASLCSVHTALFKKELQFKKIFYVRFFTTSILGIFSLLLAVWGVNYWAIIIGNLIGTFCKLILLWAMNPWRPQFQYNFQLMQSQFTFGFWVSCTAFLAWTCTWLDSILVGSYMGTQQLGIFRTGSTFVLMIFNISFAPLIPVIYSTFSKMQNDFKRQKNSLLRFTKVIILLALPMGIGFYISGNVIATLIFNDQWQGIARIIQLLGIAMGLSWTVALNGEAYKAIGKPDLDTKQLALMIVAYLIIYLITIPHGLLVFLLGRCFAEILGVVINLFFLQKYLKVNALNIISSSKRIIFSTLIMYVSYHCVKFSLRYDLFIYDLIAIIISCLSYLLCIYFLEKELVLELLSLMGIKNCSKVETYQKKTDLRQ